MSTVSMPELNLFAFTKSEN
jgi:hypothetical protein